MASLDCDYIINHTGVKANPHVCRAKKDVPCEYLYFCESLSSSWKQDIYSPIFVWHILEKTLILVAVATLIFLFAAFNIVNYLRSELIMGHDEVAKRTAICSKGASPSTFQVSHLKNSSQEQGQEQGMARGGGEGCSKGSSKIM